MDRYLRNRMYDDPQEAEECNPGDSYCLSACSYLSNCEDMKVAHEDHKCWPNCPECEKERRR
jgi:hypothetical protein